MEEHTSVRAMARSTSPAFIALMIWPVPPVHVCRGSAPQSLKERQRSGEHTRARHELDRVILGGELQQGRREMLGNVGDAELRGGHAVAANRRGQRRVARRI